MRGRQIDTILAVKGRRLNLGGCQDRFQAFNLTEEASAQPPATSVTDVFGSFQPFFLSVTVCACQQVPHTHTHIQAMRHSTPYVL